MDLLCYLEAKGLSVEDFANKLGVPRQTAHRWAVGETFPRAKQLRAILDATGQHVTLDALLERHLNYVGRNGN